MQTSQLQSMLCRNAAMITALIDVMQSNKTYLMQVMADDESCPEAIKSIRKARTHIIKLAEIQKAIKFDLHASKMARLHAVGHRRKKHGKDDVRYEAWLVATGGVSNK